MNSSVSVFLPLRSGSARVINKNTRPFTEQGLSLFQLKLDQLVRMLDEVSEIVISTNDPLVLSQATPYVEKYDQIRIDHRPDHLCSSTTKVQDLIDYVPTVVSSEHVFWMHVTAPFMTAEDYLQALNDYQRFVVSGDDFDSLMSVNRLQQFIWDDQRKAIINCDRSVNPWPNTQDLTPLYEINHAFYINSVNNYHALKDRIGKFPYLFVCENEKKVDIDWESDFALAQAILRTLPTTKQG